MEKFSNPHIPNLPTYQLHPNIFQRFHTERSYLLSLLRSENEKATKVLRQISSLDKKLTCCHSSKRYKKTSQQIKWLLHRLEQITKQEKTILRSLENFAPEAQVKRRSVPVDAQGRTYWQENDGTSQQQPQSDLHIFSNPPSYFNQTLEVAGPQSCSQPYILNSIPKPHSESKIRENQTTSLYTATRSYRPHFSDTRPQYAGPIYVNTIHPLPQLPYEGYAWPSLPTPINRWPSSNLDPSKEYHNKGHFQQGLHCDVYGLGLVNVSEQNTITVPTIEANTCQTESETSYQRQFLIPQNRRPVSMNEADLECLTSHIGGMILEISGEGNREKRRASVPCLFDIASGEEKLETQGEDEVVNTSSLYPQYLGYYIKDSRESPTVGG
ncbi:hypothetical protein B7463_g3448, partial [Scytalidium lignicola]